ncbi:uncharacterized protein DNG_05586 [Cephalotrichum gorgonifer]|uniref:AAR2 domain-containing protein n=1 Tax=Cephalotrichum gorgonifer TaxID=2041049 RepID=A0AAE8SVN4_9PEZI|nr:uncharacterized protein DNG_05586 [Cephalotrichum gorgonifer]
MKLASSDGGDSDSRLTSITSTSTPATSLLRSDSTVSGVSHVSIPAIGSYPLGSLQVITADGPLSRQAQVNAASQQQQKQDMTPDPHNQGDLALGGDVVLVLDLPEKFTVGYDSISFRARKFRGVKEIPAGAHFFWASEDDAGAMRTGFWVITDRPEQIHVVQWDKFNDVLGEPASKTEARFQRRDVADVLPQLPSYYNPVPSVGGGNIPGSGNGGGGANSQGLDDLKEDGMWQRLTSHITPKMLARVTGKEAGPWHVHTTDRVKGTTVLPAERELERTVSVVAVDVLSFSFAQTDKTYAADSLGAERTEQALDATAYMLSVVDDPERRLTDDDVVGELQLAFLVGMHLGNESCVHQWWHVVLRVFLRAYALAATKPFLASKFLRALTAQLVYDDTRLEGSVFDFGSDLARRLRLGLTVYRRRLHEILRDGPCASQLDVSVAFSELEAVAVGFGWDLRGDYLRTGKVMLEDGEEVEVDMDDLEAEDERGEFAATVVETDEAGRQMDLVSWD